MVGDTGLMAAANTNWDLLLDPAGPAYYLLFEDAWLTNGTLDSGRWQPAGDLPAAFASLPSIDGWEDIGLHVPGASIAAVAQVTMKTRRSEDEAAAVIRIDGGAMGPVTREAREPGTTTAPSGIFKGVAGVRR